MKTHVRSCLAAAGLALLCGVSPLRADYSSTVTSFSPLGYWRFDEATTSPPLNSVANSGTLGSAADGYVVLDVGKGIPGIVGSALSFTNVGGVVGDCHAKVDVAFSKALNPASFSVEFWLKPTTLGGDTTGAAIFSSLNPNGFGGANRQGVVIYLTDTGLIQFRLGLNSGYAGALNSTSGALVTGTWKHVVCTYDGTTQRIYINGVAAGTLATSAAGTGWLPNSQAITRLGGTVLNGSATYAPVLTRPAILGANSYAGNRGYDGLMDEVAVYGTVLTASKIAAHYQAATTNNAGYSAQILADAPLAYWPMNETAVTPPAASALPIAANSGSVGSAADGTNMWGTLAAQAGPAGAGFGAGNKAVYFDGANGSVGLPDAAGLHVSGNITLMAWVKPQARDFFRNIIANGLDDARGETFLRIGKLDDQLLGGTTTNFYEIGVCNGVGAGFDLLYPGGAANYYHSAAMQIPEGDFGNWVFLAGTYDGTQWNLYRNGVLSATYTSAHGCWDVTNRWSIGSRADPNPTANPPVDPVQFASQGLRFSGSIDEPAIFNTALSAVDIAAIYNAAQVPPTITRAVQPVSGTAYAGSPLDFSVWAEGSPTLSYLWYTNGVSAGVTTTNFTTILPSGAATVAVVVSNPYGSATSSIPFNVAIPVPPAFTKQPLPASRYVGRPFTFSVTVTGSAPITYQWKTNGVAIPGATSSSYSGIASAATAGNYSCTCANVASSGTNSDTVALTVVTPPTGFGAAVIGDGPVAYWRLGETSGSTTLDKYGGHDGTYFAASLGQPGFSALDPDTAVAYNGTNSYSGNISGDPAAGGINFSGHTNFSVEAWVNVPAGVVDESTIIAKGNGQSGTTASEQFALDVFPNPANGNQAFHFFTRAGSNIRYEAFADIGPDGNWHHIVGVYDDLNVLGGGANLYIYVDGDLRGSGPVRPSGLRASSVNVTIGSKHLGNQPAYEGTINGTVDEVAVYPYALTSLQISNHYALAYPGTKPTITKQPASLTVYESSPTPPSFTVGAFGEQPLTYQWKKGGVDLFDGGNIYGANTRTLTIDPVTPSDAGNYSVSINNAVGPVTNSSAATLTVIAAPTGPINVPGVVLHLPFNDSLNDTSGRGNHGTGRNTKLTSTNTVAPSAGNPDFNYVADGKLGKGLHYHTAVDENGNVTNAFFVTLGDKPDLRFSSNVNFSVAYWCRFPGFNGVGDLGDLPFIATAVNSYGGAGFTFAPSYQLGSWSYSLNGNVQLYGPDYLIDDGNWHHLVHTFDRTGVAVTYLDGKQADVRAASAAGNLDTGNPVTIGQSPSGVYPEEGYYDIDDIGIWRRALSPLEAVGVYLAATLANSSFVDITPSIAAGPSANQVTVTWQAGTLQSSTNATGVYIDVPAATSPYTTTATGATFYRTRY